MVDNEEHRKALQEMFDLLPIFSDPSFRPCEWHGNDKLPNGSITMPYPVYDERVDRLFDAYAKVRVHPYELLPEDPEGFDPQQFCFTPSYFETSTYDQTRRYFSLISRRERFCDGYIEADFRNGVLVAALTRLKALRG